MFSLDVRDFNMHCLAIVIWDDTTIKKNVLGVELNQIGIWDDRKTFAIP